MKLLHKAKKRFELEWKLTELKRIRTGKTFNAQNSLLLFCDPRGGSTWLTELLSEIPNSFVYWEPFGEISRNDLKGLSFGWRQHIPENENWPQAKKVVEDILSIRIFTEWTSLKLNGKQLKAGKIPIIKICRGNHFIPWLLNNFEFSHKPIYLLRHPFAVVASQLQQGGWNYNFKKFQIPQMRFNDSYKDHFEFLNLLSTKAEQLCAVWCITNKENFDLHPDRIVNVRYEKLLLNPHLEIERIFKEIKIKTPTSLLDNINKPSTTSLVNRSYSVEERLMKWKSFFSEKEVDSLQRVLDYFKIHIYNKDQVIPYDK